MRRRADTTTRRSAAGLSLLELLLAVAITSIIGLAMAMAMTAAARGMASAGDSRSALQRAHAGSVRLRSYVDPGRCLLQHDAARGFVLWLQDEKPGNTVNLTEMRVFWWDPAAGTITCERVVFPEAWPQDLKDSSDLVLSRGSNFFGAMLDERALGYTKTEVIADGTASASLAYTGASIEDSTRFRLTLKVDAGTDQDQTVLLAFGFSNHVVPR